MLITSHSLPAFRTTAAPDASPLLSPCAKSVVLLCQSQWQHQHPASCSRLEVTVGAPWTPVFTLLVPLPNNRGQFHLPASFHANVSAWVQTLAPLTCDTGVLYNWHLVSPLLRRYSGFCKVRTKSHLFWLVTFELLPLIRFFSIAYLFMIKSLLFLQPRITTAISPLGVTHNYLW